VRSETLKPARPPLLVVTKTWRSRQLEVRRQTRGSTLRRLTQTTASAGTSQIDAMTITTSEVGVLAAGSRVEPRFASSSEVVVDELGFMQPYQPVDSSQFRAERGRSGRKRTLMPSPTATREWHASTFTTADC
jgi:hypothetical protein